MPVFGNYEIENYLFEEEDNGQSRVFVHRELGEGDLGDFSERLAANNHRQGGQLA